MLSEAPCALHLSTSTDRNHTLLAGPLPQFDGISVDAAAPGPPTPREAGTTSPTPAAGGPIRVPPLNPEDVNKFLSLFDKSDVAKTGVLSGTDNTPLSV